MIKDLYRSKERGFTLVEVIVSLALIAVLSAMAGLGLVQVTQGYVMARQNSATVQKVQIAMARIVKELSAATAISASPAPTASSIRFTRSPGPVTNTISFAGGAVQINGETLIDNVTAFTFAYYDAAGLVTTTPASIGRVDISLTVTAANNLTSTFTNRIDLMESYW